MTEQSELGTAGHVFISYVHEDRTKVEKLRAFLEAAGIPVWTDKENLGPGDDWRIKIQEAITQRALVFLACFSEHSEARDVTYQNEELILAVEQLRLRSMDQAWLMPVRFSDCELPVMPLGAGRMLSHLHRTDLFGEDEELNRVKLITATLQMLGRAGQVVRATTVAATPATAEDDRRAEDEAEAATSVEDSVRRMIGDPTKQMAFEEMLMDEASRVHDQLVSAELFPTRGDDLAGDRVAAVRAVVARYELYWDVVAPMARTLVTVGAWSSAEQHRVLARAVQTVAATVEKERSGLSTWLEMRPYPLVAVVWAAALGAMTRENFGAVRAVTTDAIIRSEGRKLPVIARANPYRCSPVDVASTVLALSEDGPVADGTIESLLNRGGMRYTPISDHLFARLRPFVRRLVPAEEDYDELFDDTEILLGVIGADAYENGRPSETWIGPPYFGRFTWKNRHRFGGTQPEVALHQAFQNEQSQWPPLAAGMFGQLTERAATAFESFEERATAVRNTRW